MMIIRKSTKPGTRINVPAWLTDPDRPMPCICGMPLIPGQPTIMVYGDYGMTRIFHVSCWNMMAHYHDEDDDEDDDE